MLAASPPHLPNRVSISLLRTLLFPPPSFSCSPSLIVPPLRRPHETLRIPNQNPLIPTTARRPALSAKQAPIHSRHKLSMRIHAAQLAASPVVRAIGPDATRHVVGG